MRNWLRAFFTTCILVITGCGSETPDTILLPETTILGTYRLLSYVDDTKIDSCYGTFPLVTCVTIMNNSVDSSTALEVTGTMVIADSQLYRLATLDGLTHLNETVDNIFPNHLEGDLFGSIGMPDQGKIISFGINGLEISLTETPPLILCTGGSNCFGSRRATWEKISNSIQIP